MFPLWDHNPTDKTPFVTYALISINVLVFLTYFGRSEAETLAFFEQWALYPGRVVQGQDLHGLVTCMFLHGGLMHIAGNMLFLFIFGDNLEDFFGHVGFILFYLVSGFAASALQIYSDPTSMVPNVGASGAIAGVMGGYLLLYPKARVDTLVFLGVLVTRVAVPAFVMLGLWFAIQVVSGLATQGQPGGGVAYWAHAGGFVGGLALVGMAWLAGRKPKRVNGRPPYPPTATPSSISRVPRVRRRRR